MKRFVIRLASFIFTLIVGFALASMSFRNDKTALNQISSSVSQLALRSVSNDAKRQYDEGVRYYSTFIPYNPLDYEQKQNQKLTSAVGSFKQAISLKSDYYEAYLYLGHSYAGLHNYGLALEAYRQAARLKPNEWMPYYFIGHTYLAINRYGEAISFYLMAGDVSNNVVGGANTSVIKSLAVAYLEDGDRKNGVEQYKALKKACEKSYCKGMLEEVEYLLRKR